MKKKWTRRTFLQTSLVSSLGMSAGAVVVARPATAGEKQKSGPAGLTTSQRETLRMAMDEIIPAADGMPAPSTVDGLDYLTHLARENSSVRKVIGQSLAALDTLSKKQFAKPFTALAPSERARALEALEKQSATDFAPLRDLTYEAYYTQPQVWKLIGYELHPTNEAGPPMKPFDESVLANVRKMPKRYREAS